MNLRNNKQPDPQPAATAAFSSQSSRTSYLVLLAEGHLQRGREAHAAEGEIARLEAELAGDARDHEKLRQGLIELGRRIEAKQRQVEDERGVAQEKRFAEGDLARLLVANGAPEPSPAPSGASPGVKVAPLGGQPYGDPPQTGMIAAVPATESCQVCHNPMVWDEKQGYIHPVEGGYVLAGESCHYRRPGDTQAVPTADGAGS